MPSQTSVFEPSSIPKTPSPKSQVELIPWDPDSPEHLERMRLQRVECGWKSDFIERWRPLQREGKVVLQWVVVTQNDPLKEEELRNHTIAFPEESSPLVDTAASVGGKARLASENLFIPVGHIALESEYEKPEFASEDRPGLYWISTFYISKALQRYGLGRAAMDSAEEMARQEPLCAKFLGLCVRAKDDPTMKARSEAMGRKAELVLQDWYARRGFEVYKHVENMWHDSDRTGKSWSIPAVFMRKDIK